MKVEIVEKGFVIQSFALMSNDERRSHHVFPFYYDYDGKNTGGESIKASINPQCSIAVQDENNEWVFYDASSSDEKRSGQVVCYEKVRKGFFDRFKRSPIIRLRNKVKWISWGSAMVFVVYFIVHLVVGSIPDVGFSFPFNLDVITFFVIVILLILIPVLVPYIKSLSFSGLNILLSEDQE